MENKRLKPGLSEIRHRGWEILVENLGISGATEFIIQYEKGYGDYTAMRKEIFNKKGLDEILEEMKSMGGSDEK
jgi:hypothetical protein